MTDYQPIRPSALGATRLPGGGWQFVVWAPYRKRVELQLQGPPLARSILMERDTLGYHRAVVKQLPPGSRYLYRLDDSLDRPDPSSRFQPDGVHGPSDIVDLSDFEWTDTDWKGITL